MNASRCTQTSTGSMWQAGTGSVHAAIATHEPRTGMRVRRAVLSPHGGACVSLTERPPAIPADLTAGDIAVDALVIVIWRCISGMKM